MDDFWWIMLLFFVIAKANEIVKKALDVAAIKKESGSGRTEAELAALRAEIACLKTWTNDLILSFDSTLHEQNARLQSLERRALGENGASPRVGIGSAEAQRDTTPIEGRTRG